MAVPFEEGKTYKTKFATGERFTITSIIWNKEQIVRFEGIYEKNPKLGICPLNADRLTPELDETKGSEVYVCGKCGEVI